VGAGQLGRDLASKLAQVRSRRYVVCGFLDGESGTDVIGRPQDFTEIARRYFVDEVILTISPESESAQKIIRATRSNQIDLRIVPQIPGFKSETVSFERLAGIPVLTFCEEPIPALGLTLKRTLDVAISALALLFVSPLLCAIAAAVKLDSPGPVLYLARRLGRKGRQFVCFKFRTMVADADHFKAKLRDRNERQGAFFKITDDPRITSVGKILRRYSLDELPQLLNVLRGEMSLVGPRPHPVDDFERYQLEDLQRLEVTPGITGLWQVTARSDPSFERGMMLDREYICNWNLWMDFRILCKTALVVLRGEGV
jgi:exopolysaccharide biosynthesis polyprenyl glycosylphosphotransferase